MKLITFFEFESIPAVLSMYGRLSERLGKVKPDPEVANYMASGVTIVTTGQSAVDITSGEALDAPIAYVSDGEWVWRASLEVYVRRDGVPLPEGFVRKARALGRCPGFQVTQAFMDEFEASFDEIVEE